MIHYMLGVKPSVKLSLAKIIAILASLFGSSLGAENFVMADLAKARGEFPSDELSTTTSSPSTCNFVWKVTATSPRTKSPTAGTVDHGVIMDAVHHTMMDYEYRQMWMSLMRHSYPLFISELKSKGHKTFIKPKFSKKKKPEDTFEGKKKV